MAATSFAPTNSYIVSPLGVDGLARYEWLISLESQLNPTLQPPTNSSLVSIASKFQNTLLACVLSDLRSGRSGRRIHPWEERNCFVIFNLTPRHGMMEALGLKSMDDAQVREYKNLILSFVNEAGWIFCPNITLTSAKVCVTD